MEATTDNMNTKAIALPSHGEMWVDCEEDRQPFIINSVNLDRNEVCMNGVPYEIVIGESTQLVTAVRQKEWQKAVLRITFTGLTAFDVVAAKSRDAVKALASLNTINAEVVRSLADKWTSIDICLPNGDIIPLFRGDLTLTGDTVPSSEKVWALEKAVPFINGTEIRRHPVKIVEIHRDEVLLTFVGPKSALDVDIVVKASKLGAINAILRYGMSRIPKNGKEG